jgi:hypothetical protein
VARPALAAALLLLALSPLIRPPVTDPREHAALAAALLIGGQLLLGYWFYSYLTWCYPLLVIATVRARPDEKAPDPGAQEDKAQGDKARVDEARVDEAQAEPSMAGTISGLPVRSGRA